MTSNLKLLCNFVKKILGTVHFGNDQFAPILGYGDLVQGNITINRVYYVEGLNHNFFSVGQFCDADSEVAFRKSTCFVRDLQGNDLLTASPTQAWLWHRRLSHLNFDYINLLSKKDIVIGLPKLKCIKDQLCSSCKLSKAKRSSFKSKVVPSSKGRLNLLHMDLCGPMRVASINGKKYILVIVDDYSRYTWTMFLRSKDETPKVLKEFLTMIQRNLQAPVITVRTDRGTEFLNKTLNAFFKEGGIEDQTFTARTPKQNGVVERRNCTLVEAARTMLSASKIPLFFWAEAIATACYTQNKSIIIPTHDKMAYQIINDRKLLIKHLHIFGCICYITRDGENLDKMKEKGDLCILVDTLLNAHVPSQQELDLLFGPLYDEFFNAGSNQKDTQPTTNIRPTSAPSTPTYVHAEENNDDQAEEEHLPDDEFTNPFCAPAQEVVESSSHNIGNSIVPTFNQPQVSKYQWTKDHPLEQVLEIHQSQYKQGDNLQQILKCIEAMLEELHQFDRLQVWKLVDKPFGKTIIRIKWLWKNKKDEDQTVIRNKARLVAKGTQVFSNLSDGRKNGISQWTGPLKEDVYVAQPDGFVDPDHPEKAKYALEILHKHGMEKGQSIGTPMAMKPKLDADLSGNPVDQTDYHSKIESLMYLTSSRPDIHSSFGLTAFSDADHAGCIDTHKSTSGGIQFLGDKLVSWMLKKQDCTAMSSAEAEYVALSAGCAQVM
nr:retrovirus-related Pol polyprotein from transposon TNT 1-94 [Tanacetum cinerariifolium]